MLNHLRYAVRALVRQPRFTVLAAAALALGIAVNATIFSVVNAVLVRPLPYAEPSRLVRVWSRVPRLGLEKVLVSPADFVDYRRLGRSFERLEGYTETLTNVVSDDGQPERVSGLSVTPMFFDTLGVRPALGRLFRLEDVRVGAGGGRGQLSSATAYGGAVSVRTRRSWVGPSLSTGLVPRSWASCLPSSCFRGHGSRCSDPMGFTEEQLTSGRGQRWLTVVGRLKPRVSVKQAQAEMDVIADRLAREYPDANSGRGAAVCLLEQEALGRFRPALVLLQVAAGLILLIAAANVAHLQLARSLSRRREFAIHAALGATRRILVRRILAESLCLAMVGAALGLILARLCTGLVTALSPPDVPRIESVGIDGHVLAFTLLIAAAVGLLFGLPLALQASKPDLRGVLNEEGRTLVGTSRHRAQRLLVIAEVAISLVLLAGAGLLVKSFMRLERVDPGFVADEAIAMDISHGRGDPAARARFFEQLIERIEALPGVRSAGVTKDLPLSGEGSRRSFVVVGDDPSVLPANPEAECRRVSTHYLDAMGVAIRSGRGFTAADTADGPGVALVNAAFVQRFLSGRDPLGQRLLIRDGPPRERRIVGVVADVKHFGLDTAAMPEMYIPHVDRPWPQHDPCRARERRRSEAGVGGRPARARDPGQGTSSGERQDDPRVPLRSDGAAAVQHASCWNVRSAGAAAGRLGCLWSRVLRRIPANARGRRSHGPRCGAARHRATHSGRWPPARLDRPRARRRRGRRGRPTDEAPPLRRGLCGPHRLEWSGGTDGERGAAGLLSSRQAVEPARPGCLRSSLRRPAALEAPAPAYGNHGAPLRETGGHVSLRTLSALPNNASNVTASRQPFANPTSAIR